MNNRSVLLIEDNPTLSVVYQEYLNNEPYDIIAVEDGKTALTVLGDMTPAAVLLDLNLPDMDGMEILEHIHQLKMSTKVLVITAHGSVDAAVDAMRMGAFDFIAKPFDAKRLQVTLKNALENQALSEIVETYQKTYDRNGFSGFIGKSTQMQAVYRIIESAATSNATVFVCGESGTGKEVCAEAVHQNSARNEAPFVALNCAAIPKDLIESEIFGHVKGAFTGANTEREGAASLANGGTLFLDEICEMEYDLQSKILRFVQTGTFQKVGSSKTEKVNVRFVCATNRDPWHEVEQGRFREDLYYRLHVIPIELPPLRDRGDDIVLLAKQFLRKYCKEEGKPLRKFDKSTEKVFKQYKWPGNVRQLQNVIRNVVVLQEQDVIMPEHLPAPLNKPQPNSSPTSVSSSMAQPNDIIDQQTSSVSAPLVQTSDSTQIIPLWLHEKNLIESAIEQCDGNIPKAAALLEVSPSTIYRKKQAWEEME